MPRIPRPVLVAGLVALGVAALPYVPAVERVEVPRQHGPHVGVQRPAAEAPALAERPFRY